MNYIFENEAMNCDASRQFTSWSALGEIDGAREGRCADESRCSLVNYLLFIQTEKDEMLSFSHPTTSSR